MTAGGAPPTGAPPDPAAATGACVSDPCGKVVG